MKMLYYCDKIDALVDPKKVDMADWATDDKKIAIVDLIAQLRDANTDEKRVQQITFDKQNKKFNVVTEDAENENNSNLAVENIESLHIGSVNTNELSNQLTELKKKYKELQKKLNDNERDIENLKNQLAAKNKK